MKKEQRYVEHHETASTGAWFPALMLTNLPHQHPNDVVVHHLVTFFGGAFDPDHMIVHSTSWRYEQACDRLLLTYVAVLPQGCWVEQWMAAARIKAYFLLAGARPPTNFLSSSEDGQSTNSTSSHSNQIGSFTALSKLKFIHLHDYYTHIVCPSTCQGCLQERMRGLRRIRYG